MRDYFRCRLKVAFIVTLFALPVAVAAWRAKLDDYLRESQVTEPLTALEWQAIAEADDWNTIIP